MDASEAFLTSDDIRFMRNEATKSVVQDGDTTEETAEKKSHQTHRILSLSMSVFRTLCDLCVYLKFLNIPSFATSLPCVKYWFAGNLKKEFATFSPSKIQDSRVISCKTNVSSNSQEAPCSINNSSSFVVFKPRFPIQFNSL